jgi:hypothetical protein
LRSHSTTSASSEGHGMCQRGITPIVGMRKIYPNCFVKVTTALKIPSRCSPMCDGAAIAI